ncbi:MAG: SOS response-associated peptidase [Tatlockia sp.]|nr:SOS response-associated peptidase [Tatlockia sp.]
MCGRFTLITSKDKIKAQLDVIDLPAFSPQFNIAPSLPVLAIVELEAIRHAVTFRWGLVPYWAKDKKIGNGLANARSETITTKPAFREAFKSRRCLLVMSGFFEWQEQGGLKQPYYVKHKKGDLLAIAAIWESWQAKDGSETLQSCCLITTQANDLMHPVHDRMPVILNREGRAHWLNPKETSNDLLSLLKPYEPDDLEVYPVSTKVNNGRYEGLDTVLPIKL